MCLLSVSCVEGHKPTDETTENVIKNTFEGKAESTTENVNKNTSESTASSTTEQHIHSFGNWTVVKEPTCTEKGQKERVCVCGQKESQTISAKGHTEGEWIIDKEPTCAKNGSKHQICSVCNATIANVLIATTGIHSEVIDSAVEPTYTTRGKTEGSHCSVCDTVLIEQREIAPIWSGEAVQPTKLVRVDGVYYYEINSAEELAYLTSCGAEWWSYNYILKCDIVLNSEKLVFNSEGNLLSDLTKLKQWTPIAASISGEVFSGCFNGNNHTISGVCIQTTSAYYVGVFGRCHEVKNLNVSNSYIRGGDYVGGICGILYGMDGKLENCSFDGLVIGKEEFVLSTLSGGIGGLCGSAGGTIKNCINLGTVIGDVGVGGIVGNAKAVYSCLNYGLVFGNDTVGGICGISGYMGISDSRNYGTVTGTTNVGGIIGTAQGYESAGSSVCENYGYVSGDDFVGGIVGKLNYGHITNCINHVSVNGQGYVGGISGYNNHGIISNCDNIGNVVGVNNVGGIVGYHNIFSDSASIEYTYYLKDGSNNQSINGIGNLQDENGVSEGKDITFFNY
jgi:hypothetical protein